MVKKNKDYPGRALMKEILAKRRDRRHVRDNSKRHTTEVNDGFDWGRLNLQSVTAESSLQEFLSTAELANREFVAEKMYIEYINSPEAVEVVTSQPDFDEPLTVPRRPPWKPGVTANEQFQKERDAFYDWRIRLNELQAKLGAEVTPYERNLELWKELWRTLEKSDVLLILLDARNPLLFRCKDLEKYAVEQKCEVILLLNKADLTTEYGRKCWAEYFDKENVSIIFFSSVKTTKERKISEKSVEQTKDELDDEDSDKESVDSEDIHNANALNKTQEGIKLINLGQTKNELDDEVSAKESVDSEAIHIANALNKTQDDIEVINVGQTKNDLDNEVSAKESVDSEVIHIANAPNITQDDIELIKKQLIELEKSVNDTGSKIDTIQLTLDNMIDCFKSGKPIESIQKCGSSINSNKNADKENACLHATNSSVDKDNKDVISESVKVSNSHEILDRERLLEILKSLKVDEYKTPPRLTVGIVGYPNVGKSSTVNCLMQTKKVSVSTMPGHTRHIQSLILDEKLELLDCPGLVVPTYVVTADLFLTAVLPIDQMRSYNSAMARLCELVSRHTFATKYGLLLPDFEEGTPEYDKILTAHAFNRGFMTASGQPDRSRSARLLLKEAASGKLQWEQLPPNAPPAPLQIQIAHKKSERKPTPREIRAVEGWVNKAAEIDREFFSRQTSGVHVKGKPILGINVADRDPVVGKPWKQEKKHANKNKREKLRRVYSHLDQH